MSERTKLISTANELADTLGIEEQITMKSNQTNAELLDLIGERQTQVEEATRPAQAEEARTRPAGEGPEAAKPPAPKAPEAPTPNVVTAAAPMKKTRKPIDGINQPARFVGGPPRFAYQVAPTRSLQCKGGTLKAGEEVLPGNVGGQAELDKLVKSRAVLRGPRANLPNLGHKRRLEE